MLEDEKKGREENRCTVILISKTQRWAGFNFSFIPFPSQPEQISSNSSEILKKCPF